MKRKIHEFAEEGIAEGLETKKSKVSAVEGVRKNFRQNLFLPKTLRQYSEEYTCSEPYKHAVISELMDDALLRNVRYEIKENVHFTPKETDIYKIHQSGDLANLDGLEDAALSKLPSLLKLRDALYSPDFREYIAAITDSGQLSGKKTDMAINVYTPGCHLLCHDDVIGSRRVSYILYLTDPDVPWQAEWGGALRLYPTSLTKGDDGEFTKTPSPDFSKTIPPAWNQLSFFAVQPGESFHDVEEVYHASRKEQLESEGGRVRMAISGWYHIPQAGEEGYVEGLEEKLAEKSSLVQLQGKADRYDFPQERFVNAVTAPKDAETIGLESNDIDFLLKYMAPTYLTPDTMDQMTEHFSEQSSVTIDGLLSPKFGARLRSYIEAQEEIPPPALSSDIEQFGPWKIARPPHKHRFLYLQSSITNKDLLGDGSSAEISPIQELLDVFLPSREFHKWLELATECEIENYSVLGRRFRRGNDYALATSHEGNPRLELCLGLTPTTGWGEDVEEDDTDTENIPEVDVGTDEAKPNASFSSSLSSTSSSSSSSTAPAVVAAASTNGKTKINGKSKLRDITSDILDSDLEPEPSETESTEREEEKEEEVIDPGGQEIYMAIDDEPTHADAAIYKTASGEEENDNILFTSPASWNKLTLVLRDSGVLKFVKYVSAAAKGDRWDVSAVFGVKEEEEDEGGDDDKERGQGDHAGSAEDSELTSSQSQSQSQSQSLSFSQHSMVSLESSDEDDEFRGFPDSEDGSSSDSD